MMFDLEGDGHRAYFVISFRYFPPVSDHFQRLVNDNDHTCMCFVLGHM